MNFIDQLKQASSEYAWYYYGMAALFVILVLFYVSAFVFSRIRKRRDRGSVAISFDDLDSMKKTGLLSPEEEARVRKAISRLWLDEQSQARTTVNDLEAEAARTLAGVPAKPLAGVSAKPLAGAPPASETPSGKMPKPAPEKAATASLAEMARKGLISEADLEELRAILEEKKKKRLT